jgi:hypothetical protein
MPLAAAFTEENVAVGWFEVEGPVPFSGAAICPSGGWYVLVLLRTFLSDSASSSSYAEYGDPAEPPPVLDDAAFE